MRIISIIICLLLLTACDAQPKDYLSQSGINHYNTPAEYDGEVAIIPMTGYIVENDNCFLSYGNIRRSEGANTVVKRYAGTLFQLYDKESLERTAFSRIRK